MQQPLARAVLVATAQPPLHPLTASTWPLCAPPTHPHGPCAPPPTPASAWPLCAPSPGILMAPVCTLPRPTCSWLLCVPPPRIPLQCIRWLGARGRVGVSGALPTTLRGSCARSEEAPLRTGPEDLQELDSLDTEKSLLCGLGSG